MHALPAGETVTIVRRTSTSRDIYGNDMPGAPVEIPVPGCGIAPQGSGKEQVQGRDTVTDDLILYAPYGTDLRATDQVLVDGALYEINGSPNAFRSPFSGSTGPVVAAIQLVTG